MRLAGMCVSFAAMCLSASIHELQEFKLAADPTPPLKLTGPISESFNTCKAGEGGE